MIIVTNDTIADMQVVRTLGLVRGTSVRGRHFGRDLVLIFISVFLDRLRDLKTDRYRGVHR